MSLDGPFDDPAREGRTVAQSQGRRRALSLVACAALLFPASLTAHASAAAPAGRHGAPGTWDGSGRGTSSLSSSAPAPGLNTGPQHGPRARTVPGSTDPPPPAADLPPGLPDPSELRPGPEVTGELPSPSGIPEPPGDGTGDGDTGSHPPAPTRPGTPGPPDVPGSAPPTQGPPQDTGADSGTGTQQPPQLPNHNTSPHNAPPYGKPPHSWLPGNWLPGNGSPAGQQHPHKQNPDKQHSGKQHAEQPVGQQHHKQPGHTARPGKPAPPGSAASTASPHHPPSPQESAHGYGRHNLSGEHEHSPAPRETGADQNSSRTSGEVLPVLPLGAGLASIGLGLAFVAMLLRRR